MMKQRILIVGGDTGLRATLARWLIAAGYSVELAESARRAREVLANERIGLAIVAPERLHGGDFACELRTAVDRFDLGDGAGGRFKPVDRAGRSSRRLSREAIALRRCVGSDRRCVEDRSGRRGG